jgi:hypothetical protein
MEVDITVLDAGKRAPTKKNPDSYFQIAKVKTADGQKFEARLYNQPEVHDGEKYRTKDVQFDGAFVQLGEKLAA